MNSVAMLLLLMQAVPADVRRLEWTDPQGRRPMTYASWIAGRASALDGSGIGTVSIFGDGDSVVDVVVNVELYQYIVPELAQYEADLEADGYTVQVDTTRSTNPAALRTRLAAISRLAGAVLVGEVPIAWYERGWGGGPEGEEFPIEAYFADLNGTWGDADADGLFDSHTGSTSPEIWVGRLYARPLTWDDEVRLVKRYFAKNHRYRTEGSGLPDRGLTYTDDDWAGMDCFLDSVYSDMTLIENGNTTSAPDYRTRLAAGYEWIQVCCHSSPWGHTFRVGSGFSGTVFNTEVYAIRPRANFYNLFACSGTRFVEENYSAGWDIFQDDYGLCAVGSAKTGSMLSFDGFYRPLGHGACIGDAFKSWYAANAESDPDWFYGMNIIGDPTLKPHGSLAARPPVGEFGPECGPFDSSEVVGTHPETDDAPRLLAMPDSTVWAIWKSGRSSANGRFDIYAARRAGGTWSSPYNIGAAEYWETDPALGLDASNRPVAVWSLFTNSYYYNLVYSVWNGSSWSTPQTISDNPSSDLAACLCRDSVGTLWCFWYSRRDLDADIFAATFNGTTWTSPVNLTHDMYPDLQPAAVATTDGRVWVTYTKYRDGGAQVWAQYWNDTTWTEAGPVSGTQARAYRPTIASVSQYPMVCWQSFDSGNGEICSSVYDGAAWSTPVVVGADTGLDVHPSLATDRWDSQHLVWMSTRSGNWDVYCARYMSPAGWTSAWPVETATGPDINPDITANADGDLVAVWQNLTEGNWDINAEVWQTTSVAEPRVSGRDAPVILASPARGSVRMVLPPGRTGVAIIDAAGRKVRDLSGRDANLTWDGRDESGMQVPTGVYLVNVRTAGSSTAQSVLFLR